MKIIKDLRPKTKLYKFIHPGCCEFLAFHDEFVWTTGQYNEKIACVTCPLCGEQFYSNPEEVDPQSPDIWPDECPRYCSHCNTRNCIYRKEDYLSNSDNLLWR